MASKPPLTLAAIRAMQPGDTLWCHVVTGLHIRLLATKATWSLYYRAHSGARRVLRIGSWPQLPLEAAREVARETLKRVALGEDPAGLKQQMRNAPTMADLADEWRKRKAPPVKKPRSFEEDVRNLRLHVVPRLGKLRVADVSAEDLAPHIAQIERKSGPSAARAVRALVSGMLTLAETDALKWRPKRSNPVSEVPLPRTQKRRVHIRPEQFAALARELEALRPRYPEHVACIWCALLCGTRITELATAKRAWIHGGLLILDEHKTSYTGNERVIRLTKPALAEIDKLPVHPNGYIFGEVGAFGGHARRSIWRVFDLARTAAKCPEIRPQDMRRTFASAAKSKGVSLDQIGELFSHRSTQTTALYAWLFDDAAEDTANEVAALIKSYAAGGSGPSLSDQPSDMDTEPPA